MYKRSESKDENQKNLLVAIFTRILDETHVDFITETKINNNLKCPCLSR